MSIKQRKHTHMASNYTSSVTIMLYNYRWNQSISVAYPMHEPRWILINNYLTNYMFVVNGTCWISISVSHYVKIGQN